MTRDKLTPSRKEEEKKDGKRKFGTSGGDGGKEGFMEAQEKSGREVEVGGRRSRKEKEINFW